MTSLGLLESSALVAETDSAKKLADKQDLQMERAG